MGGAIGTQHFKNTFITNKLVNRNHKLDMLTEIALNGPHAAYSGFSRSEKHELTYLQRIHPELENSLTPHIAKLKSFAQMLIGTHIVQPSTFDEISLPIRNGGLGIDISYASQNTHKQHVNSKFL